MRRLIGLVRLLPALLILTAALPVAAEDDFPDYAALLAGLLDGYQRVMVADAVDDPADEAGAAWDAAGDAVRRGLLRFTIDPTNGSIVDGALFFAPPDENVARIYLSVPLLEYAADEPTASYGILMGAVAEAAIFLGDPEAWLNARGDALDRLIIMKTCRRIQAEMTRNRLAPMGLDPGPYAAFVLDSMENDGLAGAMLYLDGLSLPTAASLEELRTEFRHDGDTEALRNGLLALGEDLIAAREALPPDAGDDRVFPTAAAIHTWLEITPGLIAEAHGRYGAANSEDFADILQSESEYDALRRRLDTTRIGDMPLIFHVVGNVKARFEMR